MVEQTTKKEKKQHWICTARKGIVWNQKRVKEFWKEPEIYFGYQPMRKTQDGDLVPMERFRLALPHEIPTDGKGVVYD